MVTVPLTHHHISMAYLLDRLIASLIAPPLRLLIAISYYLVHGPRFLGRRYNVVRRRLHVKARDGKRIIRVDAYVPSTLLNTQPGSRASAVPIHINWHGSGFVLDCFGADGELCAHLANALQCIVLDADYAKAPQRPFPAAIHDAEDVCRAVLEGKLNAALKKASLPILDTDNISVGGSSAGANLALAMGVVLGGSRIRAVTSIAPPCDFRRTTGPKRAPLANHRRALPRRVTLFFDRCYLTPQADRTDPRLSPVLASMAQDQLTCSTVFIATGQGDTLYNDGARCIENLQKQGHSRAIFRAVEGEGHGFEKAMGGMSRTRALAVFEEMVTLIRNSWQVPNHSKL